MTVVTLIKKTFNWVLLTMERVSPSWQEAQQHPGRHGAREVAESSTSRSTGSRKESEPLGLA